MREPRMNSTKQTPAHRVNYWLLWPEWLSRTREMGVFMNNFFYSDVQRSQHEPKRTGALDGVHKPGSIPRRRHARRDTGSLLYR